MKTSYVLRARRCRACDAEIPGVVIDSKPATPTSIRDCLRRCACGKGGFSNGKSPTWIFADPSDNVPLEVRAGVIEALADSVNERSRKMKAFRFGFETSEDAVTWTVFRHLQQAGVLRERLAAAGNIVAARARTEPALLLWGSAVPAPDAKARALRGKLLDLLRKLGEHERSYSEPHVLLDFDQAGIVVIEAKYRSENENKSDSHTGWPTYLHSPAFRDAAAAKRSGLYDLVRNWRIVWELSQRRPLSLVNLGTARASDKEALDRFQTTLNTGADQQFQTMTWTQLLGESAQLPPWLRTWAESRNLVSS